MTTLRESSDADVDYSICHRHFITALQRIKPSLSREQLAYYSNLTPDSAGIL